MTPATTVKLDTLRRMARSHAGAFFGEIAAWKILANLRQGTTVDIMEDLVCLGGRGQRTVARLLVDLSKGGNGLSERG